MYHTYIKLDIVFCIYIYIIYKLFTLWVVEIRLYTHIKEVLI